MSKSSDDSSNDDNFTHEQAAIFLNLSPSEHLNVSKQNNGNDMVTTVTSWKILALLIWNILVTLALFAAFIGVGFMTQTTENAHQLVQLKNELKTEFYAKIGENGAKQTTTFAQINAKNDEFVAKIDEKLKKYSEFDDAIQTKVAELEEQQKKLLNSFSNLNFHQPKLNEKFITAQQNCWDVSKCHNELEITGNNCLKVNIKDINYWRRAFAKYSILNTSAAHIFYFEILIRKMEDSAVNLGIALKQNAPLAGPIGNRIGTFLYGSNVQFFVNGSNNGKLERFDTDDVVGCGVNLANRQLFFTKNGRRIGPTDLFISSSPSADQMFPFVSLFSFGDKIETNFGPKFMFNLATLG